LKIRRKDFVKVAEGLLPEEFPSRIYPERGDSRRELSDRSMAPQAGQQRRLPLGVPATKTNVFDVPIGPAHIVLYPKNIESTARPLADVAGQGPLLTSPNPPAYRSMLL
jgi:hypothetical protein